MEYIFTYITIFLFGIVIGSFLNVCIYRLPNKENIISERSHCMSCGNVLKWYELIPVASFLIQRGRCRHCGARLSRQYPAVELLNGIMYVLLFATGGFRLQSALYCLGSSALIVISVIDWRTFEIPSGLNVFLSLLGVVRMITDLSHWRNYVMGFFIVSGFFLLIYLLSKGRAIGGGDVKLMAGAGLLLGWKNILVALVLGCAAGSVIHLTLMRLGKRDRTLAFGPYLSLGIMAAMLFGERLIGWYLTLF